MRIIICLFILCAVPVVSFGQKQTTTITDSSICANIKELANYYEDNGKFKEEYDTLQYFIKHCYDKRKAWMEFNSLVLAAYGLNDNYVWEPFREWLKSVLYLNTSDSDYYCADVQAVLSTFHYFNDERGHDINGALAVVKYLIESGKCKSWDMVYDAEKFRLYDRQKQLEKWRDTVTDSIKTSLDTTLPTLEDLGLGILRGQSSVSPATHESRLGEFIATRNPFTDILELKYRLDKSAMVRIDVYDLLGRTVYSEGQGYKTKGEHVLSLQPEGWSSGSYYVRLSSPSGEVKTVKVVKE